MAREIALTYGGHTARFGFSKVTRQALYGARRRVALDPDGQPCTRASLTEDGSVLVQQGMLAQGYFDEHGNPVSSRDLVGLDGDGNALEPFPSTLGEAVEATEVPPQALLDLVVQSVYALTPNEVPDEVLAALNAGKLLQIPFVYRPGFKKDTAILLANDTGPYAIIGQSGQPVWSALETPALVADESDDDDLGDDLDFEMF